MPRNGKYSIAGVLILCLELMFMGQAWSVTPPLKFPAATQYGVADGSWYFRQVGLVSQVVQQSGSWGYRYCALREDGTFSDPVWNPVSPDSRLHPVDDRKFAIIQSTVVAGYYQSSITLHEVGSTVTEGQWSVSGFVDCFSSSQSYIAVAYNRTKVRLLSRASGFSEANLDLSGAMNFGESIREVVAGPHWVAVLSDNHDTRRWRFFDPETLQQTASFNLSISGFGLLGHASCVDGRFLVMPAADSLSVFAPGVGVQSWKLPVGDFGHRQFDDTAVDGSGFWAVMSDVGEGEKEVWRFKVDEASGLVADYRASLSSGLSSLGYGWLTAAGGVAVHHALNGKLTTFDPSTSLPLVEMVEPSWLGESDGAAVITVVLDEPARQPSSVRFTAKGGSATESLDFIPLNTILQFDVGQRSASARIPILPDKVPENHETISLELSEPVGLQVRPSSPMALVIRASGFEENQNRLFRNLPTGWAYPQVVAVTSSYVLANLLSEPAGTDQLRTAKLAAFDVNGGGFISFADFGPSSTADISESNGEVGMLEQSPATEASRTLTRWNPRAGSASRVQIVNCSTIIGRLTTKLMWDGGDKLTGGTLKAGGPAETAFFSPLEGMEIDGALPFSTVTVMGSNRIGMVGLYGKGVIGSGIVYRLRAFAWSRQDHRLLWSSDLGETESYVINATMSRNELLVANNRLISLNLSDGSRRWECSRSELAGIQYRIVAGPEHVFVQPSYGQWQVLELGTGACLGRLEHGDLFNSSSDSVGLIGGPEAVFLMRRFPNWTRENFGPSEWVEICSQRQQPAVLMDPPVLVASHGGSVVSFSLAEAFDRPVRMEVLDQAYVFSFSGVPPKPKPIQLEIPASGGQVLARLQLPPSLVNPIVSGAKVEVNGRIFLNGEPMATQTGQIFVTSGITSVRSSKVQIGVGTDFTNGIKMLARNGLLLVGYPGDRNGGIPGSGKIEVFDASTGVHVRTLMRPSNPVCYDFGAQLLVQSDKLLVGAPGIPDSLRPRFAKTGSVHVYRLQDGQKLASILNPTSGPMFGQTLASSSDYFAVSATNPNPQELRETSTVSVFSWRDYKKVLVKSGNRADYFGQGLAIAGGELLVGSPEASLRSGRTTYTKAGRIQSFGLPKGRAGSDWISPWITTEKGFGASILQSSDGEFVVASGEMVLGKANAQVFGALRGQARFLLKSTFQEPVNLFDAAVHRGDLFTTTSGDLVLYSLGSGEVSAESTLADPAPNEPASYVRVTCFNVDEASRLFWIDHGKCYRADAQELGGFRWWSRFMLPDTGSDPNADTNGNQISDLYDYIVDRTGTSPMTLSVLADGISCQVDVKNDFPRDVIATLEIQDLNGNWRPIGNHVGGLWFRASGSPSSLSNGSPSFVFQREPSWAFPLNYRISSRLIDNS